VRVEGEDDKYPKDFYGRVKEPARFTIHAEKAPNRRGVSMVLSHFGSQLTYGDVAAQAAAGGLDVLYAVGGDPAGWLEAQHVEALAKAELVVVQDIFPSRSASGRTSCSPAERLPSATAAL
jgi:NADH-quinone oxidoreductase subunit G